MPYKIIFTHDPQDFFEGIEGNEIFAETESIAADADMVEYFTDGGYYAIITKQDEVTQ